MYIYFVGQTLSSFSTIRLLFYLARAGGQAFALGPNLYEDVLLFELFILIKKYLFKDENK